MSVPVEPESREEAVRLATAVFELIEFLSAAPVARSTPGAQRDSVEVADRGAMA